MKTRLNKFLAKAGLGTRRQSEKLVKQGKVKVNGEVEKNPGRQVGDEDRVEVGGKQIRPLLKFFYLLFNKAPQNSALDNEEKLQDLLKNTESTLDQLKVIGDDAPGICGLMLLTNDDQLEKRLTGSGTKFTSVLHLTFDHEIKSSTLKKLRKGEMSRGLTWNPISVNYEIGSPPNQIQLEILNFQTPNIISLLRKMDLNPTRIDRVHLAGMNKKGLSRDRFRDLTYEEVIRVRYFGLM